MDELILKIRADAKGVRPEIKGIADETDGLELSSRKASTAMRGFVQDLAQARNASDIASAALGAFSKILGTTLVGTAAVMAGKVIIDSFQKVSESVNKAKDSLASAREEIAKMGAITSLAEGATQANLLYKAANDAEKAIKEIEKSKLQNFIAEIRGAKDELSAMAIEARKAAGAASLEGIQRQAGEISVEERRTEADKAAAKAAEKFTPLINEARKLGNQPLVESLTIEQQKAAQKAVDDLRQKALTEQASKEAQQELKGIEADIKGAEDAVKILRKYDEEAAKKEEERLTKLREEKAKAEEKSRQEQDKLQERSLDLEEKKLTAQDRVNKAREALIDAEGEVAEILAKQTGTGRGGQARASSFEIGAQKAAERAFQKETQAQTTEMRKQIKKELGPGADGFKVNREIQRRMEEQAKQRAKKPFDQQQTAQENLQSSTEYLKNIDEALTKTLEELKSYAHAGKE